jgi:hypothetical protein
MALLSLIYHSLQPEHQQEVLSLLERYFILKVGILHAQL